MNVLIACIEVLLATCFGGMVFFPSVVAPIVFRVLDDRAGRVFLRTLFPRYYLFIIVLSALGAGGLVAAGAIPEAVALGVIVLSTGWVRQSLVPKMNAARDASLDGDPKQKARFGRLHGISMSINAVQMLAILVVMVRV